MATTSTSHLMMRRLKPELILAQARSRTSRRLLATTELHKMQSNNVISSGRQWEVPEQTLNRLNSNSKLQSRKRRLPLILNSEVPDLCSRNLNMQVIRAISLSQETKSRLKLRKTRKLNNNNNNSQLLNNNKPQ